MKYMDLMRLKNGLTACPTLKGVKFAYAAAKNSRMIDVILADLQKTIEPDDGFKAFEKARTALCEKHTVVDEKTGKPKIEGGRYVIEDPAAHEVDFEALKESAEHKEAVDRHEEKGVEYQKLLKEGEADYEPYMIPLADVPSDITTRQLEAIYEIVAG